MKHCIAATVIPLFATVSVAHADIQELTNAELRHAISDDRAIASYHLIASAQDHIGGAVLDVRAFEIRGTVVYRILVQQDDGALCAVMLDGTSGEIIAPSTQIGRKVADFAKGVPDTSARAPHSAIDPVKSRTDTEHARYE